MNNPFTSDSPELIERDEVVTSGETEYCIMARAPFTRFWRLVPITVNSWLLAGEAASSSTNASATARAVRVHSPRSIEADGNNCFVTPFAIAACFPTVNSNLFYFQSYREQPGFSSPEVAGWIRGAAGCTGTAVPASPRPDGLKWRRRSERLQ